MIHSPKHFPAPPSLAIEKAKANGTYRTAEVIGQLRTDFFNKCYLCEDGNLTSINVEHFNPHQGDKDLEYEWENLFYCCVHCNSTKGTRTDLLNATVALDGVETRIKYELNPMPKEVPKFTALDADQRVVNTVALLNEIFNGTTPLKITEAANLRKSLLAEFRAFTDILFAFYDLEFNPAEQARIAQQIRNQLHQSAKFAAFKRWIIRIYNLSEFLPDVPVVP